MKIHFTKMHGLGNDFILIENLKGEIKLRPEEIRFLCDRHFGVGADGILTVEDSEKADFKMRIFNADGSEAEMCGNGIRCFALYARRQGLVSTDELNIETLAGIIKPEIKGDSVAVDMGEPLLAGPDIPVNIAGKVINHPVTFSNIDLGITCVSMGNPHCVIFYPPEGEPPVSELGPVIENDDLFPRKTNVEFVQVQNPKEIKVKVWERGAGLTLACGTGACASVVAGVLNQKTARKVLVHLPGGDLDVEWKNDNRVCMTGPAEFVFKAEFELKEI